MSTPIGDAVVKVKIDTTDARATLDKQDEQQRRIGRDESRTRQVKEREERQEKTKARGRRKFAPRIPTARGVLAAVPFAGAAVLMAEYGPGIAEMTRVVTERVVSGLPSTIRDIVNGFVGLLVDQVNDGAERIAKLESTLFAAFGGVTDAAELAKVAFLWKQTDVAEQLLKIIEGRYEIRKAQGMGRWAERQIRRKAVGEGFGTALADLIKTQE